MENNLVQIRMHYSKYKNTYSQYTTVSDSYDKKDKTIIVLLPEKKANIYNQKTGGSLSYISVTFRVNATGEEYSHLFSYFTSAKDNTNLKKRIREFEKLNDFTCLSIL